MADRTDFAGLTHLDPGESIAGDRYGIQDRNPTLLDYFARLIINHRHDGHAALVHADPAVDPSVGVATGGGSIPADTTVTVGYTLLDQDGGETLLNANPQSVTTDPGLAAPDVAPVPALETTAGILLAGDYSYAVTVTDGLGGETTLSPQADITIPPGAANNQVRVTGLDAVAGAGAGWRLWRMVNGGEWHLLATGDTSTTEFLDDGTTAADCSVTPPLIGTSAGANLLSVTIPSGQPTDAVQFRVYASLDGTFTGDCLLGTYDVSQFDQTQTYPTLAFLRGTPPSPATAMPGAERIQGGGGVSLPGYPADYTLGLHGPNFARSSYDGSITIWEPGVGNHVIKFDSTGYESDDDRLVADPTNTYSFNGEGYGQTHYYLPDAKQMGEGSVTLRFQFPADPGQSVAVYVGSAMPGGRRLYAKYQGDAGPNHYLSLVVYDPSVENDVSQMTDADGNNQAYSGDFPLNFDTDYWLRYSVTGATAKAELFDTDPTAGSPTPVLAFTASASNGDELAQVLYGGPPAFGWENQIGPNALHLLDVTAHADSPGLVEPPPPVRPKVTGVDLPLKPYAGSVEWDDPSGLSAALRPTVEEYGTVSVEKVQDFSDAFVLNSDEMAGVSPGAGIDAENGYLIEVGDLNQYVGLTWKPGGDASIPGDFIFAAKVNRPDGAHLGGMVMLKASGGYDIWGYDMPDGQTFNFGDPGSPYNGPGLLMRNPYQYGAANPYQYIAAVDAPAGDVWNVLRREAGTWRFERWNTDPFAGSGAPAYAVESPAADGWNPYPVTLQLQGQFWREQGSGTFQAPAITVVHVDELRLRRKPQRVVIVATANGEDATGAVGAAVEQRIVVGA